MEEKNNENQSKSVFVIVRETTEIKTQLEEKSRDEGFSNLSEFIREMWRKWL